MPCFICCMMQRVEDSPAVRLSAEVQKGLLYQGHGRRLEAAACYQQACEGESDDADALLLLGLLARESDQFGAALSLLAPAAKLRPDAEHFHWNLATTYLQVRELDLAAEACSQALQLNPNSVPSLCCLANIEEKRGNQQAAVAAYERAIAVPSESAHVFLELGNYLCRRGEHEKGLEAYNAGIEREPSNADLYFAYGAVSQIRKQWETAKGAFYRALALKPRFPEVHYNLGKIFQCVQDMVSAEKHLRASIELNPKYLDAYSSLADVLGLQDRYEDSIECYRAILDYKQDGTLFVRKIPSSCLRKSIDRYRKIAPLGQAALLRCSLAEVRAYKGKCASLHSKFSVAHTNLATTYLSLNQPEEMKWHYKEAFRLDTSTPGVRYNYGLTCLREGNYREGWKLHENRWLFSELHLTKREFSQPEWKGEPFEGKTLLVCAEQGHGDTLQFVRYLPMIAARGGKVVLEVQQRLYSLLRDIKGADTVIARGEALPEFDYHCTMMSLPAIFQTEIDTVPCDIPYVSVPKPVTAGNWQRFPRKEGKLRVGISWSGSMKYKRARRRAATLKTMLPLASVSGVEFFSLQCGAPAAEIKALQKEFPLIDACSLDTSFMDAAGVMSTLDLVISVDTAIPHLAGSMGLPVWVLLPYVPDWRWMEKREDCPWYPTVRLFRQQVPSNWASVIEQVCDELQRLVRAQSSMPRTEQSEAEGLEQILIAGQKEMDQQAGVTAFSL